MKWKRKIIDLGFVVVLGVIVFIAFNRFRYVKPILMSELQNYAEDENKIYALDKQIEKKAKVEFKGYYNKNSTSVKCKIISPDVYTYIINNLDELQKLETDALYNKLLTYIQTEDYPNRNIDMELACFYQDGQLIVDTSSFECQDALHGGMNSALTEMYIHAIEEIEDKLKTREVK